MTKIQKTIFIITGIILTIAVINYFVVVVPRQVEMQKGFKIESIKTAYQNCERQADFLYNIDWDAQCEMSGEKEDCGLSNTHANRINKVSQERKDRCFDNYKLDLSLIK